jgi:hypothetical protein
MDQLTDTQIAALLESRDVHVWAHPNTLRSFDRKGWIEKGSIDKGMATLNSHGLEAVMRAKACWARRIASDAVVREVSFPAPTLVGQSQYDTDRVKAMSALANLVLAPDGSRKEGGSDEPWADTITRFLEAWYIDAAHTDMDAFAQEWVHGPYRDLVVGEPVGERMDKEEKSLRSKNFTGYFDLMSAGPDRDQAFVEHELRELSRMSATEILTEFDLWDGAARTERELGELYAHRARKCLVEPGRYRVLVSEVYSEHSQRHIDRGFAYAAHRTRLAEELQRRETRLLNEVNRLAVRIADAANFVPETTDFVMTDNEGLRYPGGRSEHVLAYLQRSDKVKGLDPSTRIVAAALYKCYATGRMELALTRRVCEEYSPYELCQLVAKIECLYTTEEVHPDGAIQGVGYLADTWINNNAHRL